MESLENYFFIGLFFVIVALIIIGIFNIYRIVSPGSRQDENHVSYDDIKSQEIHQNGEVVSLGEITEDDIARFVDEFKNHNTTSISTKTGDVYVYSNEDTFLTEIKQTDEISVFLYGENDVRYTQYSLNGYYLPKLSSEEERLINSIFESNLSEEELLEAYPEAEEIFLKPTEYLNSLPGKSPTFSEGTTHYYNIAKVEDSVDNRSEMYLFDEYEVQDVSFYKIDNHDYGLAKLSVSGFDYVIMYIDMTDNRLDSIRYYSDENEEIVKRYDQDNSFINDKISSMTNNCSDEDLTTSYTLLIYALYYNK